MLCVVSEDTERVIGERRMATLRDLGAATRDRRAPRPRCSPPPREQLERRPADAAVRADLPRRRATTARLACAAGIDRGRSRHAPAAARVRPGRPARGRSPQRRTAASLDDLAERFGPLPTGGWAAPPRAGARRPAAAAGPAAPYGFLVAGAQPATARSTTATGGFVELVAGQLAAGIAERPRLRGASGSAPRRLAELDRAKTAFFTNVSHEFRTPLTLLLGPAEDALGRRRRSRCRSDQRERVEVIHRNAQRLLKLVNTLLDFSRLESGRVERRVRAGRPRRATPPSSRACSRRRSSAPG